MDMTPGKLMVTLMSVLDVSGESCKLCRARCKALMAGAIAASIAESLM